MLPYDVSIIPTNADVTSAIHQIYLFEVDDVYGDMGYEARHLSSSWSQNNVTWNSHMPAWGGVIAQGSAGTSTGWQNTDIKTLVQEWVQNPSGNKGFILIGDERNWQQRMRKYYSRESGGNFPRLQVEWSVCCSTQRRHLPG